MSNNDELLKALIAIGAGQGDSKEVAIQALENYMEEKPMPPRQFIRLTDEEILEIVGARSDAVGGYTRKLFDTIQDKLEEKNNG